jgi:hypothetical protein
MFRIGIAGDSHDLDGVADHVGRAFLASDPLGIANTLFGNHLLDCFLQAVDLASDCRYVRLGHVDPLPAGQRLTNEYLSFLKWARLNSQLVLARPERLHELYPFFPGCHHSVLCFPVSIRKTRPCAKGLRIMNIDRIWRVMCWAVFVIVSTVAILGHVWRENPNLNPVLFTAVWIVACSLGGIAFFASVIVTVASAMKGLTAFGRYIWHRM